MSDSDIMGNIAADCRELPKKQEMIGTHEADCTCESCCMRSESTCEDDLNQCAENQQPSGGLKKMKNKLTPILANCAVLLLIFVLSAVIGRARSSTITAGEINSSAIEISHASVHVPGNDFVINESASVEQIDRNIEKDSEIDIAELDNQIDSSIIDVENRTIDIDAPVSSIDPIVAVSIESITPVGSDLVSAIRS